MVSRSKDTLEATEMDMGIDLDTTHMHMFTIINIDNHICLKPGQNYCANSINYCFIRDQGGSQLEFVSISRVINHMTCYKLSVLIG